MELVAEPGSFPPHLERLPYHDGEHTDEDRAAGQSDLLPSSGPIRCGVRSRPTANTSMRIIDRPPPEGRGRQRPPPSKTAVASKIIKGLLDLQEQILGHGLDDRSGVVGARPLDRYPPLQPVGVLGCEGQHLTLRSPHWAVKRLGRRTAATNPRSPVYRPIGRHPVGLRAAHGGPRSS